jgi:iron-sulfur cluster assembly protein
MQPVSFSEKAIEEIKKIMQEKKIMGTYYLRVAVGGGGCSGGVEPILGFDKQKDTDMVYEIQGVTVLVDKKHMMHLIGKQVEFYEVEDTSGFHFTDQPIKTS